MSITTGSVLTLATEPGKKYRCPTCRNWYRPLAMKATWSCCVLHAKGDCCHAFEERVHKKGWHKA